MESPGQNLHNVTILTLPKFTLPKREDNQEEDLERDQEDEEEEREEDQEGEE